MTWNELRSQVDSASLHLWADTDDPKGQIGGQGIWIADLEEIIDTLSGRSQEPGSGESSSDDREAEGRLDLKPQTEDGADKADGVRTVVGDWGSRRGLADEGHKAAVRESASPAEGSARNNTCPHEELCDQLSEELGRSILEESRWLWDQRERLLSEVRRIEERITLLTGDTDFG